MHMIANYYETRVAEYNLKRSLHGQKVSIAGIVAEIMEDEKWVKQAQKKAEWHKRFHDNCDCIWCRELKGEVPQVQG